MTSILIPKLIHQIWLGNRPMHTNMEAWRRRWQSLHPNWMYRLWHEETCGHNLAHLYNDNDDLTIVLGPEHSDLIRRAANLSQLSNIWRYNLMYWVGGLYVDTDIEPYKPIDDLVADLSAFTCARTHQHRPLECALIGAVPKHPWLCELKDRLVEVDPAVSKSMGVDYFTPITEKYLNLPAPVHGELGSFMGLANRYLCEPDDVTILPETAILFEYPNPWTGHQGETPAETTVAPEGAYARHHWSAHWYPTGFESLGGETQQIPTTLKIGGICLIDGCAKDREKSSVHCPEHRAAFGRFPVPEPAASIGWLQNLIREESNWPAIASSARYLMKVLERANVTETNLASSDRQIRILVGELLMHRSCPNPLMAGEVAVELIRELKVENNRLKALLIEKENVSK